MKIPVLSTGAPEPKKFLRADSPPAEGFTVMSTVISSQSSRRIGAAEASGRKLKSAYPMLKVDIYAAAMRGRTLLS
jgi:hypothetical protein